MMALAVELTIELPSSWANNIKLADAGVSSKRKEESGNETTDKFMFLKDISERSLGLAKAAK